MVYRKYILLLTVAALLLLSGCAMANIDELLIAPKLPGENDLLKQELDKIRGSGAVPAVPETGERQSVKLIDLDADGIDEAVAFFRTEGGGYNMYVFRWLDDHYELVGVEEGSGFSLRAFYLPQRDAAGRRVLAVAWSLDESSSTFGMSIFGYNGQEIYTMLDIQYSYMDNIDIDGDSASEFIFIVRDPATERKSANIYGIRDDSCVMLYTAPLCNEAASVKNIQFGLSGERTSALFIDSTMENQNYVTDVIDLGDRQAINETRDPASGEGALTQRTTSVYCQDIDGDGIIDVPASASLTAEPGDPMRSKLNWNHFSEGKILRTVASTYHSVNEGWHLMWPEGWDAQVRVKRSNSIHMTRTEFYIQDSGAEGDGIYEPGMAHRSLLTVMVFSGDNMREYFTQYPSAKFLKMTSQRIYCFSLPAEPVEGYGLTEDRAREILVVDAY